MIQRSYETPHGTIVYWVNKLLAEQDVNSSTPAHPTFIFLPGLTADHRLFDKQVEYFENRQPLFVWDAPGHAASRPFELKFELADKARWLYEILNQEGVERPLLVGQSMGAYVSQMFMQLFPEKAIGFISIDSAPLQRSYYSGWELWLLKRMEPCFRLFPHNMLVDLGAKGNSETEYGRALMRDTIASYDHRYYAALSGHGFKILAEAVEKNLPYTIPCPAMLVCGQQDNAGSTRKYNKKWTERSGLPIHWIEGAGHNSNTDKPDVINHLIEEFAARFQQGMTSRFPE